MISNIYQNRYAHLRDIIERHGGQSAVAEKLEVSKQYIGTVGSDNPRKNIGNRVARKIETVFGLPIGTIDQPIGGHGAVSDDATVTVPLLNVVASMGHGAVMDWEEETVQEMRFSKRWLRYNTDASSFATLAVVTAKGDSMMPHSPMAPSCWWTHRSHNSRSMACTCCAATTSFSSSASSATSTGRSMSSATTRSTRCKSSATRSRTTSSSWAACYWQ